MHAREADPAAPLDGSTRDGVPGEAREPLEDAFCCSYATLVAWIAARTRDRAAAEDIADEAFERLLIMTGAGRCPTHTAAWLRRVSINLVISRARRARVAERHVVFLLPPAPRPDPTLDAVLARERWGLLLAALEQLPASQRTVLVMAAWGSGPGHMAAALGIQPGAARTRLHRARRALRSADAAGTSWFAPARTVRMGA
jgi:RNA polymerase sigma-70 factor, ECF subfamily